MTIAIDREDEHFLLEDVDSLGPSLHILIILLHLFPDELLKLAVLLVTDEVLPEKFTDQLLQKEGGVDVRALLYLLGEENELDQLHVVAHDGVVEISIRPELIHVLPSYRESLSLLQLLISQQKLPSR